MKDKLVFILNLLTGVRYDKEQQYYVIMSENFDQTITPGEEYVKVSYKSKGKTFFQHKMIYSELDDIQLIRSDKETKLVFVMKSLEASFYILIPHKKIIGLTKTRKPIYPNNGPVSVCDDGKIYFYTDGSIQNRMAGWAFVAVRNGQKIAEKHGSFKSTKSTDAEMRAIAQALKFAKKNYNTVQGEEIIFRSDCKPIIDKLNQLVHIKRLTRNIMQDAQMQSIYDLSRGLKRLHSFQWVKGHSGERWNDKADDLANDALNE